MDWLINLARICTDDETENIFDNNCFPSFNESPYLLQ